MRLIQSRWPNNLGVTIIDEQGRELGEVWETLPNGNWGIRTFKENGEADKSLRIDPSEHLFMSPEDAIMLCRQDGNPIE